MDKFTLVLALFICFLLIVMGVVVWFAEFEWAAKLVMSFLFICSGVGLGVVGVDLWRGW